MPSLFATKLRSRLICPHCGEKAMSWPTRLALNNLRSFPCRACGQQVTIKNNTLSTLAITAGLAVLWLLGTGWLLLIGIGCMAFFVLEASDLIRLPLIPSIKRQRRTLFSPHHKVMQYLGILTSKPLWYLIICLPIFAWFFCNAIDAKLSPQAIAYMKGDDHPADTDNGIFAIMGLGAPKGEDAYKFGLARYQEELRGLQESKATFKDLAEAFPVLDYTAGAGKLTPMSDPERRPTGFVLPEQPTATSALDCALLSAKDLEQRRSETKESPFTCMTDEHLAQHLVELAPLLQRYSDLYKYPRFYEPYPTVYTANAISLLDLHRYVTARTIRMARQGDAEGAYAAWAGDMTFLNRLLLDQQDLTFKAMEFIMVGENLRALPALLEVEPALAARHQDAILALLRDPVTPAHEKFLQSVYRAEYQPVISFLKYFHDLQTRFLYKENATTNILAAYYADIIAAAKQTPDKAMMEAESLRKKYEIYSPLDTVSLLKLALYNPLGKMMIAGNLRGETILLQQVWSQQARREMLILATQARAGGIKAEAMPEFLKTQAYRDPFTQSAYRWDPELKAIYFIIVDPVSPDYSRRTNLFYP